MMELHAELREKLRNVKSDVEACKMLADSGINVEEFEKSLSPDELAGVNVGFTSGKAEVYCPECKEAESDNISCQFWASLFTDAWKYRCRTCGTYFDLTRYGSIVKINK